MALALSPCPAARARSTRRYRLKRHPRPGTRWWAACSGPHRGVFLFTRIY